MIAVVPLEDPSHCCSHVANTEPTALSPTVGGGTSAKLMCSGSGCGLRHLAPTGQYIRRVTPRPTRCQLL